MKTNLRNSVAGSKEHQCRVRRRNANRKRRILARLDLNYNTNKNSSNTPNPKTSDPKTSQPMLAANNIRYEVSERCHAISHGGIGAVHAFVKQIQLAESINRHLRIFKFPLPYHESDHVLNIAYNALCDGENLDAIELRRNDEAYLNAIGATRIPDPTTAGDFCRRFKATHHQALHDAFDEVRLHVWRQDARNNPCEYKVATIDMDGTFVETRGECKQGIDISYDGRWGYHPLIMSLANTQEVLWLENRSGNRPSHEGAAVAADRCIALVRRGGFQKVLLRGDTDFSQTVHLDRWNDDGVKFIFGYDSRENLIELAESLAESEWSRLVRLPDYLVKTAERQCAENVKERIVEDRGFRNIKLKSEEVAEFAYQPKACGQAYRMIVVKKNLSTEEGARVLFDNVRYFFYITNVTVWSKDEAVGVANNRCNQENLLSQLKSGAHALSAPTNTLASNGAYMAMVSLAWNLKTWIAMSIPAERGRWQERHRAERRSVLTMEFKTFVQAFIRLPCQIIRTGRRVIYRLLTWNCHQPIFWRFLSTLRC